MSFQLAPNSVTFNDLERCNSLQVCVISPNSVAFGEHYVKVLKIHRYFLRAEMYPKECISSAIIYWQVITLSESVEVTLPSR